MTRLGVVTAPGSMDAAVALRAVRLAGVEAVELPTSVPDLRGVDAVLLHGGGGSPLLSAVVDAAGRGLPVLGIGDGFRVLCEAGLLPGSLVGNASGRFVGRDQRVRVASRDTVWTCAFDEGQEATFVLRTAQGRFVADPDALERLEGENQVVLRHVGDPTGSANDIAGITNARGTVVGFVVHTEYAMESLVAPSEDGRLVLHGVVSFLRAAG